MLINDAGRIFSKYTLSKNCFESTFALKYIVPVLLTLHKLHNIEKSDSGKIINIGSSVHKSGRTEFDFKFPEIYITESLRNFKTYANNVYLISCKEVEGDQCFIYLRRTRLSLYQSRKKQW